MIHNPIICALDVPTPDAAAGLITKIRPHVGAIKLGLEFVTANGPPGVNHIAALDIPIFLDLKFHDIPNTVAGAIRSAVSTMDNLFLTTIHTLGGYDMMRAAKDAALEAADKAGKIPPKIIGVTILTSMQQSDLEGIGVNRSVNDQVLKLAELAQKSGIDGVVCSPLEIAAIRQQCGDDFTLVVPGIRPVGSAANDQKRIMTPQQAIDAGATHLVIGRPITQADKPAHAASTIAESINI